MVMALLAPLLSMAMPAIGQGIGSLLGRNIAGIGQQRRTTARRRLPARRQARRSPYYGYQGQPAANFSAGLLPGLGLGSTPKYQAQQLIPQAIPPGFAYRAPQLAAPIPRAPVQVGRAPQPIPSMYRPPSTNLYGGYDQPAYEPMPQMSMEQIQAVSALTTEFGMI